MMATTAQQFSLFGRGVEAVREAVSEHTRRRLDAIYSRRSSHGYCAHWDCGGQRLVVMFAKTTPVCRRHWRQRRRIRKVLAAARERGRL